MYEVKKKREKEKKDKERDYFCLSQKWGWRLKMYDENKKFFHQNSWHKDEGPYA
jgi:hypothetical protein